MLPPRRARGWRPSDDRRAESRARRCSNGMLTAADQGCRSSSVEPDVRRNFDRLGPRLREMPAQTHRRSVQLGPTWAKPEYRGSRTADHRAALVCPITRIRPADSSRVRSRDSVRRTRPSRSTSSLTSNPLGSENSRSRTSASPTSRPFLNISGVRPGRVKVTMKPSGGSVLISGTTSPRRVLHRPSG